MTEQLGVERTDDDRFDWHFRAQGFELPEAFGQKIRSMGLHCRRRPRALIQLLVPGAAGDAMIFQSGEFALRIPAEKWPQVIQRQVVTDIPVKIPVSRVTGISLLLTPYLPA